MGWKTRAVKACDSAILELMPILYKNLVCSVNRIKIGESKDKTSVKKAGILLKTIYLKGKSRTNLWCGVYIDLFLPLKNDRN